MKSFIAFLIAFALIAAVTAQSEDPQQRSYGAGTSSSAAAKTVASSYIASAPTASAYPSPAKPVAIPAPLCPRSYLFSCQPSLTPSPCTPPAASGSYGGAGSYSHDYPMYSPPQLFNGYQPYF